MKIGLYFGSFNPVHTGHLIIANSFAQDADLDQVWFVVTPLNPFKKKADLLHHFDRIDLVDKAIEGNSRLKTSDVEFRMPQPNYTINTLEKLSEQHPLHEFVLILGQDNLPTFHKWKEFETILKNYQIYCYPRPYEKPSDFDDHQKVKLVNAPLIEISSSYIRQHIKNGKSIQYLVPEVVEKTIAIKKFYW